MKSEKLFLFLLLLMLISGCSDKKADTASAFALDTVISVTVYDGKPASEFIKETEDYERLFSATIEGSDIYRINAAGGEAVKVSPETIELLEKCRYYYEISDGRIDPTIGSVSSLWDFHQDEDNASVPSEESINEALKHVGFDKLIIDGDNVILSDPGTKLDLGFIAKGYIADRLMETGCRAGLLNLGGNVSVCGTKTGNKLYRIGIEKPFSNGESLVTIDVSGKISVVTSGNYERYFEKNGYLYHHILDAKTGYPVENELSSVTIVSGDAVQADALSTTCFVMGTEEGMKLIENTPGAEALFIDKNLNISVSSGFPEYKTAGR